MITVKVTFTLDRAKIISRSLGAIDDRASDLTPAYDEVVRIARGFMQQAIETEGASTDFGPWKQLAPSTQAQRKREGYGPAHPMLRRSNSLYRSVTADAAGGFTVRTPQYLAIGSDDPKIVYHQSTTTRHKIPRRPVASFTADQKTALFRPIRLYVTGYDPATPNRGTGTVRGVGQ